MKWLKKLRWYQLITLAMAAFFIVAGIKGGNGIYFFIVLALIVSTFQMRDKKGD